MTEVVRFGVRARSGQDDQIDLGRPDAQAASEAGGYTVVTSMDVKAQNSARHEITRKIKDDNKNAVLIAGVEPGTGHVKALAAKDEERAVRLMNEHLLSVERNLAFDRKVPSNDISMALS